MKREERQSSTRDGSLRNASIAAGAIVIAFCTLRDTQIIIAAVRCIVKWWQFCKLRLKFNSQLAVDTFGNKWWCDTNTNGCVKLITYFGDREDMIRGIRANRRGYDQRGRPTCSAKWSEPNWKEESGSIIKTTQREGERDNAKQRLPPTIVAFQFAFLQIRSCANKTKV